MLKKSIFAIEMVAVAFIVIFLITTIMQRFLPEKDGLFGYKTFVIITDSMYPKLAVGDVILVKTKKYEKIKAGDILTYKGLSGSFENKIITHQVINTQKENGRYIFYTKGIANDLEDPAVYEEQVYGVMVHKFWLLSVVSKLLRNTFGFIFLIIIPAVGLVIMETKSIRKEFSERSK